MTTDVRNSVVTVPSARGRARNRKNLEERPYTDDILHYLATERNRLTKTSLNNYDYILRYLTSVLTSSGTPSDPRTIDRKALGVLIHRFEEDGLSASSQKTYMQTLSSYCHFYGNDVVRNAKFLYSGAQDRDVDWLTAEQLYRLTNAITDPMLRCAVLCMSQGAMRRIECIRLRVQDVDLVHRRLTLFGKGHIGGKKRVAPLLPEMETAMRRWLDKRGRIIRDWLDRHPDGFPQVPDKVFIGLDPIHDRLVGYSEYGSGWNNRILTPLKRYCREALGVSCGNHTFRRTMARIYFDQGVRVEEISSLLGHKSVETTLLYIGIDTDRVEDALMRAMGKLSEQYGKAFE